MSLRSSILLLACVSVRFHQTNLVYAMMTMKIRQTGLAVEVDQNLPLEALPLEAPPLEAHPLEVLLPEKGMTLMIMMTLRIQAHHDQPLDRGTATQVQDLVEVPATARQVLGVPLIQHILVLDMTENVFVMTAILVEAARLVVVQHIATVDQHLATADQLEQAGVPREEVPALEGVPREGATLPEGVPALEDQAQTARPLKIRMHCVLLAVRLTGSFVCASSDIRLNKQLYRH